MTWRLTVRLGRREWHWTLTGWRAWAFEAALTTAISASVMLAVGLL